MIKINRETDYADMMRSYKIVLDNEFLGKINRGETRSFQIKEGRHTLYLKIDWCRSNIL